MKKKIGVEKLLWRNFWVMILLVFLGIAIPYFMIIGLSNYYEQYKFAGIKSAEERIADDYTTISTQDILDMNGSIAVVTGNLSVINLAGDPIFNKINLSKKEWSDFLISSGELDVVNYDIAYNSNQDFWLVIGVPVALTIRFNYAANSDSPENASAMNWVAIVILCYFLVIGLGAIIYAKVISKRLTKPIRNLGQFTTSLESGDYLECHENCGITEIDDLQMGLNDLSKELEQHEKYRDSMEEQQRQLVMEISHDLKNPLASIQGYSELLMDQSNNQCVLTEDKKKNYIKMIHSNCVRANELLLSLFAYSQIESRSFTLKLEKINICEFVRLVIADYIPILEDNQFILDVDVPELDYECMIDLQMLRRVFDNLFWNSMKYNMPGTSIQVLLRKMDKKMEIQFSDNGKGIPREYIEKIFLPFTRLDSEVRNSKEGGSGLGLAIVKRIISLHKGTIQLISDKNQGCTFIIHLSTI